MDMNIFKSQSGKRRQGMGRHQSSHAITDTWLTPRWVLDALGKFQLDPCAARTPYCSSAAGSSSITLMAARLTTTPARRPSCAPMAPTMRICCTIPAWPDISWG